MMIYFIPEHNNFFERLLARWFGRCTPSVTTGQEH
jgi:hypothetical protein